MNLCKCILALHTARQTVEESNMSPSARMPFFGGELYETKMELFMQETQLGFGVKKISMVIQKRTKSCNKSVMFFLQNPSESC